MGAMEYISNNKEWIFSGIGAVVIGVLIAFFQKTIVAFFKKKADGQNVIQEQKTGNGSINIQSGENTNPARLSTLTPEEIIKELKKLPPLQEPDVIKHYCGIRIKWQGKLSSISKISDDIVGLSLNWDMAGNYVFSADVKLANYSELAILKRGAKIEVEGIIKNISYLHYIDIEDNANLRFL